MQRTNYDRPGSFWGNLASFLENSAASLITLLLIPALLAVALLLPPVNLLERIQSLTLTEVDERGATIVDPDGTMVTFPGELVQTPFRVAIESVPRTTFLSGEAGEAWRKAADALPNTLTPRSPLYQLGVRGAAPGGAVLQIPIPNDSEPYETLGVYTWTGSEWSHLPTVLLQADDRLESQVIGRVPTNFVVMQTSALLPRVAANIGVGQQIPVNADNSVVSIAVAGLYLRGDGALEGQLQGVPQGNYEIVPVLRNWHEGSMPRIDLLNNMLIDPGLMDNQLNAVTDLLIANPFPAVVIDYRGVDANVTARADFVRFVTLLAERLHAPDLNKRLAVRVEYPHQVSSQDWNTLGYDWLALGEVVDTLIVPAPVDPRAYQPGAEMEALLAWAASQVERSKIQIELPGRSVERSGSYLLLKGYEDALMPLIGQIQTEGGASPGQPIEVTLENPRILNRLNYNEATAAYSYSYLDDQGFERTVTIENASSFAHKLSLLDKYNITQVMIRDLDRGDVDPNIWEIARQFQEGVLMTRGSSSLSVAYTIKDQDGSVLVQDIRPLDNPRYAFAAPSSVSGLKVEAQLVENSRPVGLANSIALAFTAPAARAAEVAPEPTPDFVRLSSGQIVNARQGPSTQYPVIGQVQPGAIYRILGKNQAGDWWQIDLNGQTGWTIGSLVNPAGDTGSVAVITDIPAPPAPVVVAAAPVEQAREAPAEPAPAAAPAPAPVAAPAPTGGGNFGYGVQAHMVHNDQAGKVMQMTTGMGFNWVKQQIEWKVFEANPGQIDWGSMEGIVNAANGAGVNLLFSIVNAPDWAREPGFDRSVGGPPQDPQTFANFLGAVAGRYCGSSVKAIEVWNEQNLHYEWGNKPLNAGEYVALLRPSYAAIKAACPSMKVISGALTPAGNNGNYAIDDMVYLEQMFQAGMNNYIDGIGAHPSGYNVPPSATWQTACEAIQRHGNSFNGACDSPHHSWSFRSTMEGYRNLAVKYGAGNKLIWPTEFGWAAGGAFDPRYAYANDNSYEEQAAWTVEAYQMMRSWGWVGPAILWNLNFRVVANGTEKAQWGIVDPNWGPLPVYNALRDMPK
ncbi:MAG: SH3 domain-containing protein [Caldilineaceae bacterium]|nr:SH3 domain-containing protein [Caldilineaceae bacterium]